MRSPWKKATRSEPEFCVLECPSGHSGCNRDLSVGTESDLGGDSSLGLSQNHWSLETSVAYMAVIDGAHIQWF